MMIDVPESAIERWDAIALKVKRGRGHWVIVAEQPVGRRGGRNEKVKAALERRGLTVEVRSRLGHGTPERPWNGWRTWARTL